MNARMPVIHDAGDKQKQNEGLEAELEGEHSGENTGIVEGLTIAHVSHAKHFVPRPCQWNTLMREIKKINE